MGESTTDVSSGFSRRDFIHGKGIKGLVESAEGRRSILVAVRDFTDIELSGEKRVSLAINDKGLQDYVNRKLIQPLASDFPGTWNYIFDIRPRPAPGSPMEEYLKHVMGLTMLSDYATVLINVSTIWETLPIGDKSVDRLREVICRAIAHETIHVAQYSNLIAREQAIKDSRFRKGWEYGGRTLAYVGGLGGGAMAHYLLDTLRMMRLSDESLGEELSGGMNRRKFLTLIAASTAGSLVLGNLGSEEVAWTAVSFFDQNMDPSHKLSFKEAEEWKELIDLIQVGNIMRKQ